MSERISPGSLLKQTRESRGISIIEVAQRLLLSKKIITAIENDDYNKIPAQVYAEGYLKAYAQFLQLPVAEIIDNLRSMDVYKKAETTPVAVVETPMQHAPILTIFMDQRVRWIAYGVAALLILLVIIFAANRNSSEIDTDGKIISQLPVINELPAQTAAKPAIVPEQPKPTVTTDITPQIKIQTDTQ